MLVNVLAIVTGLVVGTGLALLIGLPLRRRTRAKEASNPDARRRPVLGTPGQRKRVLWVAAGLLGAVVVARMAGAGDWTAPLFVLSLLLAGQTAVFALIDRYRRRQGRTGS
jgi:hypothetical protein